MIALLYVLTLTVTIGITGLVSTIAFLKRRQSIFWLQDFWDEGDT
jgi:hypothetical protein